MPCNVGASLKMSSWQLRSSSSCSITSLCGAVDMVLEDHINTGILHPESETQDKGDSKTSGL